MPDRGPGRKRPLDSATKGMKCSKPPRLAILLTRLALVVILLLAGLAAVFSPAWLVLPPFAFIFSEMLGGFLVSAAVIVAVGPANARRAVVILAKIARLAKTTHLPREAA